MTEANQTPQEQPSQTVDMESMSKPDLIALANTHGLTLKGNLSKAAIIAAINEVDAPEEKYRVKRPLLHDGELYGVGQIVVMKTYLAEPRIADNTIEVATKEVKL